MNKRKIHQLIVPDALVAKVLHLKHDSAGHMASQKSARFIQREYLWLDLLYDVKQDCKSCISCAPLTLTSQPTEAWQEIATDLKGPFGTKPTIRVNRYVMVTIDLLTRAVELVTIPDKTAKTVAEAMVTHVFSGLGILGMASRSPF